MRVIEVEGLGNVEIAGDAPNDAELRAIRTALDAGKPEQQPPQPQQMQTGTAKPISGMDFFKSKIREKVSGFPGLGEFVTESAPATIAGGVGAAAGIPFGPAGVLAGASAGGLFGEWLAQKSGVAPESKVNMALSGASPIVGAGVGKGIQLAGKAVSGSLMSIPPVRSALANVAQREATEELGSLGGNILAKQKGLMARPQGDLWEVAKREGVSLPGDQITTTRTALESLDRDLQKFSYFPEGEQAIKLVDNVMGSLSGDSVSFADLVAARQMIGRALSRAESAAGLKLGSSKQLYKAMSQDIDAIAKGATKGRRQARVAQAAAERSKLEFAISDFDEQIARLTKPIPGEEDALKLNVNGLQKWLMDTTNPKSAKYDKNFVSAFKDELPALRKRLSELAKLTADAGNPAGSGSLVIRGMSAGTGALIGNVVAGAPGAALGGLIGASGPESMSALLMQPKAYAMLKRATNLGKGQVSAEAWANIGQVLNQAATKSGD